MGQSLTHDTPEREVFYGKPDFSLFFVTKTFISRLNIIK
jgi:hypothetical protein